MKVTCLLFKLHKQMFLPMFKRSFGKISVLAHIIVFKIMQTNPYPDPNFYSNICDETACINSTLQHGNYPDPLNKIWDLKDYFYFF